ncbi:MAG TPA: glycerol kinase GlpK, partial [Solirubrobacteraceae bacterium]
MILAIDQGTTGTTCLVFDEQLDLHGRAYREFEQHFPRPGWVEHDAAEIWDVSLAVAGEALEDAGVAPAELQGIGITNQRETVVAWDPDTGEPLHRALVWQDRRTAARCDELRRQGHEALVRERTGLVLDPYFSGTKIEWLLHNVDGLRERAETGRAVFGTIDSWLIFNLTGERVTDPSNASRTLLYGLGSGGWDEQLLGLLDVPERALPEIRPSCGVLGTTRPELLDGAEVPVAGVAGDQQAALFGQACLEPGLGKNTYGTGSFVLVNTGTQAPAPAPGLLATVAWGIGNRRDFALEASIFVTGAAVQWLRDGLQIVGSAAETEAIAATVESSEGVVFVPALTGLGAPHWDPHARGAILGLTRGTTRAHIVRATLEAIAFEVRDVLATMPGADSSPLRVDGGASANDLLCRLQADQLGVAVERPEIVETTALGAAFLAGLGVGVWDSPEDLRETWQLDARFEPTTDPDTRAAADAAYSRWQEG